MSSRPVEARWSSLRDERSAPSTLSESSEHPMPHEYPSRPELDRGKNGSDLNPLSSIFQPFASPPRTMPDISQLSFSDKGSNGSDDKEGRSRMTQSTPRTRSTAEFLSDKTPGLTASATTRSTFSTGTQSSPFTPHTPFARSASHPVTPLTPYHDPSLSANKDMYSGLDAPVKAGTGQESAAEIGRYLLINDLPRDLDGSYVKKLIGSIANFKVIIVKNLRSKGSVIVSFYDSREAAKVHRHLHAHSVAFQEGAPRLSLHCMRIDRRVVDQIAGEGDDWESYWSDAESTVVIELRGDIEVPLENLENSLNGIGEVQSIRQLDGVGKRFIADFWDTRAAAEAVKLLTCSLQGGAYISTRFLADVDRAHAEPRGVRRVSSGPARFTLGSAVSTQIGMPPHPYPSPRTGGRSGDVFGPYSAAGDDDSPAVNQASPTDEWLALRQRHASLRNQESTLPRPYGSTPASSYSLSASSRAQPIVPTSLSSSVDYAMRHRRDDINLRYGMFNKKAIPPDNRVHPDLVLLGQDTRTTVMIKDVPNKLAREELVSILYETVPGGFDFVYLRFDFKNACNVGYAFVNFTSLQALHDFITARVGKRWNLFSSEKVLQICYADIQGKERLINKFRNSDVMTAPEQWRPQIFYSEGTKRGQPEPFPEPDHPAMRAKLGLMRMSGYPSSSGHSMLDDSVAYDYTTADFDQAYGY